MKYILAFILIFVLAGACLAGPQARLQSNVLDLGAVAEGKAVERSFFIENKGDAELEIKSVTVTCGCVRIVSPKDKTLVSPGQRQEVKIFLDTTGFSGDIEKYVYIASNDPNNPTLKVAVRANVALQEAKVVGRFQSFTPLAVLGAGLVDGINPCAFTVLVFFISFLTFAGYGKSEMLIVGLAFIFSVYVTYFLIGLGLFDFLRRLEIFRVASHIIYGITAAAAFVLGAVSLYDFWIYRKTKDPEKMKLQLPAALKHQIHRVIRMDLNKKRSMGKLVLATLACGFLVSFLELVCTGQLYLPTIVYILKVEALKIKALMYLVLYNIMFVVPLLVILIFGASGMTSQRFAALARRNLAGIKLITAAVFFALGALLFIMKG